MSEEQSWKIKKPIAIHLVRAKVHVSEVRSEKYNHGGEILIKQNGGITGNADETRRQLFCVTLPSRGQRETVSVCQG